jgi:transposase-like protein
MTTKPFSERNGVARLATSHTSEVQPPSTRRTRSAAEKLRIIQEYDSYPVGSPERGAVLRRAGIYTSQISKWRKQRDLAAMAGLAPRRRGPKPLPRDPLVDEVEQLRKENARLQARLAQAETIIDVQKKVAQVLGSTLPSLPLDER